MLCPLLFLSLPPLILFASLTGAVRFVQDRASATPNPRVLGRPSHHNVVHREAISFRGRRLPVDRGIGMNAVNARCQQFPWALAGRLARWRVVSLGWPALWGAQGLCQCGDRCDVILDIALCLFIPKSARVCCKHEAGDGVCGVQGKMEGDAGWTRTRSDCGVTVEGAAGAAGGFASLSHTMPYRP